MKNRIIDKIEEIEKYLEEIKSVLPKNFEEYKNDFKIRAICERYSEKIIEAVVDLAFLLIKEKRLKIPDEDKKVFDILNEEKIISSRLTEKLKDAKGMRNVIAHEYGKIDDRIVFESVKKELIKDTDEFIENIKKQIKEKK